MFSYRARRTIFCKRSLFTTVKLISFSFCPADKVPVGLFVLEKIYLWWVPECGPFGSSMELWLSTLTLPWVWEPVQESKQEFLKVGPSTGSSLGHPVRLLGVLYVDCGSLDWQSFTWPWHQPKSWLGLIIQEYMSVLTHQEGGDKADWNLDKGLWVEVLVPVYIPICLKKPLEEGLSGWPGTEEGPWSGGNRLPSPADSWRGWIG